MIMQSRSHSLSWQSKTSDAVWVALNKMPMKWSMKRSTVNEIPVNIHLLARWPSCEVKILQTRTKERFFLNTSIWSIAPQESHVAKVIELSIRSLHSDGCASDSEFANDLLVTWHYQIYMA